MFKGVVFGAALTLADTNPSWTLALFPKHMDKLPPAAQQL
jgi:hypothetical protein